MKIAILEDYQDTVRHLPCFDLLKEHDVKIFTNSARGLVQQAVRLAEFDALVLNRERTRLSAALLQRLPKLKLISQTGRVGAHIDLAAAQARGITVCEGVGDPTAPAELAWALIMAASRKIPQYAANLREGRWQTASINPELNILGTALKGRTLGIWGYGRIGQLVAGYGRAFGMRVLIWSRDAGRVKAEADGFACVASKEALFEQADVLTVHLRLTAQTQGIISGRDFQRMKPGALFVNTSRAALVESGALERGLRCAQPAFAAVDVFEDEPIQAGHPLLKIPTVLATPHIGYVERDSYEMYFEAAFRNVLAFAEGKPVNVKAL